MKNYRLNPYSLPKKSPQALQELIAMDNVILSPHIAGWTVESKQKLAQTIVDKIVAAFKASG